VVGLAAPAPAIGAAPTETTVGKFSIDRVAALRADGAAVEVTVEAKCAEGGTGVCSSS
jgi:hypothetical protein